MGEAPRATTPFDGLSRGQRFDTLWSVDRMQRRQSWWGAFFAMTSVDAVSAAIYGGVLLAHIPRAGGVPTGWHSILSVVLVVTLFAMDRAEALRFPLDTTPTRVAISLLVARIALMGVVVQLDAST